MQKSVIATVVNQKPEESEANTEKKAESVQSTNAKSDTQDKKTS